MAVKEVKRSRLEVKESAAGPGYVSIWRHEVPQEGPPRTVCLAVLCPGELDELEGLIRKFKA